MRIPRRAARRTGSSQSMVMSEKIKPGDPPETAAASSSEPVPDWLTSRLRRMFSDVMDEPVPDEFKALLKQLEDKERGS
jgi:hypothetical protein